MIPTRATVSKRFDDIRSMGDERRVARGGERRDRGADRVVFGSSGGQAYSTGDKGDACLSGRGARRGGKLMRKNIMKLG